MRRKTSFLSFRMELRNSWEFHEERNIHKLKSEIFSMFQTNQNAKHAVGTLQSIQLDCTFPTKNIKTPSTLKTNSRRIFEKWEQSSGEKRSRDKFSKPSSHWSFTVNDRILNKRNLIDSWIIMMNWKHLYPALLSKTSIVFFSSTTNHTVEMEV